MDGHGNNGDAAPVPGDDSWARFLDCLEDRHSLTDLTLIGKGGMGRVYRARDRDLNRWVAVKVLDSAASATTDSLHRFQQESRILGQLRHPAIVGVHSARTTPDGVAYFVMDHVDGGDLGALIAGRRRAGGPFTVGETVALLRPVADALDTIHRMDPQVIHRDVKPANILVPEGDHRHSAWNVSVLTDFGISLTQDETRLTSAGFLIGTDRYMAPEQFRSVQGGPVPGASVDRYAFALIVFEMLTLRPLRETMSQEAWRFARQFPDVPAHALAAPDQARAREVCGVLARALADDPAQRYDSAHGILTALENTVPGTAVTAPDASAQGARAPRRQDDRASGHASGRASGRPRRRIIVAAAAVVAVVVLGVGGAAVVGSVRHPGWSGDQAAMVSAFPQLLPDRQKDTGWLGMTCAPATAGRASGRGSPAGVVGAPLSPPISAMRRPGSGWGRARSRRPCPLGTASSRSDRWAMRRSPCRRRWGRTGTHCSWTRTTPVRISGAFRSVHDDFVRLVTDSQVHVLVFTLSTMSRVHSLRTRTDVTRAMPNYDLYTELGLDKDMPPAEIGTLLEGRINGLLGQGYQPNSPEVDQLATARAILSEPAKRNTYEAALAGPDGIIDVSWLHRLADSQSAAPVSDHSAPSEALVDASPSYDAAATSVINASGAAPSGDAAPAGQDGSPQSPYGQYSPFGQDAGQAAHGQGQFNQQPQYNSGNFGAPVQPAPAKAQFNAASLSVAGRVRAQSKAYLACLAVMVVGMIYPLILLFTADDGDLSIFKGILFAIAHSVAWVGIAEIVWGVRRIVAPEDGTTDDSAAASAASGTDQ